jgi:hypothetical protein
MLASCRACWADSSGSVNWSLIGVLKPPASPAGGFIYCCCRVYLERAAEADRCSRAHFGSGCRSVRAGVARGVPPRAARSSSAAPDTRRASRPALRSCAVAPERRTSRRVAPSRAGVFDRHALYDVAQLPRLVGGTSTRCVKPPAACAAARLCRRTSPRPRRSMASRSARSADR